MGQAKFILVIVEGKTDADIINQYVNTSKLNNKRIKFKIVEGDILTSKPYNKKGENIIKTILNNILKKDYLEKSDFVQIIQLIDIDGIYFPKERIKMTDSFEKNEFPKYRYDRYNKMIHMSSKTFNKTKKVWELKKDRINELINLKSIMNIEYHLYYNSFFLEHVLGGNVDITDYEKSTFIDNFLNRDLTNEKFMTLLKEKLLSQDYKESWNKMKNSDFLDFDSSSNMYLMFNQFLQ
ncbi:hypothetical protein [Limosilactobacillus reuteri]|uniref:hypothetical protein n=1 Tax=Limosilactobacillus reuteri TaxID=1598 RepID=UPI001E3D87EC|nr:hypothetical protein [Limosilactobacillus reuteri]MCC4408751.1 hypothetical protein [Limosilactobacillus reuteri]